MVGSLLASFIGLPRWAHGLIALSAAVAAFFLWLHFHDRGVIKDHESKVTEAVASQSASASASASAAVSETKAGVEAGNAKAREAAAKSSDPLRDGLNALPKGPKSSTK